MSKLCGFAIVAVFVVWQIMDFIIHTIILAPQYAATASMWRPEGEMKMGLMMIVSLIASAWSMTGSSQTKTSKTARSTA